VNRDEFKLHEQWLDIQEEFVKAKQADDSRSSKEYKSALRKMENFKAKWRGIRQYIYETQLEETGTPEALDTLRTLRGEG
jgi:hypothetical protein